MKNITMRQLMREFLNPAPLAPLILKGVKE